MADAAGYAILRDAIPSTMAQQAADAITGGLPVTVKREKFTEFEVPLICLDIREEFIKVS